jgi:hypothetical protein
MNPLKQDSVATLPVSTRIHFIMEACTKEKRMRERVLKGNDRAQKVEEMDICLDYLAHIEAALAKAKVNIADHKLMVMELTACAERHGIVIGADYIHRLIIQAVDFAMKK